MPKPNVLVVVGDLNAHIGVDEGFKLSYHQHHNENGGLLHTLISEENLIILNTKFQRKKNKLWTFSSDGNNPQSLDFIITRKKWANSVKNIEAFTFFESLGSDHRVVVASLKMSFRVEKLHKSKANVDWTKLKNNDIALKFESRVKELLEHGNKDKDEEDPTIKYQRFVDANAIAAKEILPKRFKRNVIFLLKT